MEPSLNLNYLSENIDIGIYDDPIFENTMTFGDNVSWGCSESLSLSDLRLFCVNQLWKEKMIYEVLTNLTYVGRFGNPNRHFINDWVEVNDDFDLDSYQSTWDSDFNRCLVPAVIDIDIMYANFGLVNNTQSAILKVSRRLESIYWYGVADESLYSDNDDKFTNINNFHTHIRINYYKVTQTTVWFFASGPKIIPPKNIMYPFRVGKTQYWKNDGYYLRNHSNMILYIVIFVLFI